jgi:ribosome-interacting GTPase 1
MAYLDNIIIYLNSVEKHKKHIKWVLRKLYKENMLIAVKKYKFHTRKTNFIGFIIKLRQISIDLKKIKAIVN